MTDLTAENFWRFFRAAEYLAYARAVEDELAAACRVARTDAAHLASVLERRQRRVEALEARVAELETALSGPLRCI